VEQYEAGKLKVPAELTVPSQPLNNGLPRLLTKDEIRGHKDLETQASEVRARPVQPTELYSALNSFLVAAVLLAFFTLAPKTGRVFALMLILDGGSRYLMEMIRVEPAVLGKLSFSMVLGAGLVLAGILMWIGCGMIGQAGRDRAAAATASPA
jgi:prolipoprotein diacylglyceryltransferase